MLIVLGTFPVSIEISLVEQEISHKQYQNQQRNYNE